MGDKIEMSLDEIIKTSKIGNFRRGGARQSRGVQRNRAGGGAFRGGNQGSRPTGGGILKGRNRGLPTRAKFSRGDVNSAWKHDMFEGAKKLIRTGTTGLGSAKLLVSNLDYGVSETDIHELFADFGPLKNASVHYDRSGRSLGTADVIFERRSDAVKAMKQYNGVPLDGRPMNIQLATSEVPSPTITRSRVGGGNVGSSRPIRPRRGASISGRAGGGGGRPVSRTNGRTPNITPSVEELDAELDAYVNDMKL